MNIIQRLQVFIAKREINRVFVAHTLQGIAFSMIGIYFPIFLLENNFSLTAVIVFFVVLHTSGVLFSLIVLVPLLRKWGPVKTLKLYYPLVTLFFILFNFIPYIRSDLYIWLCAVMGGISIFTYWTPINILFVRHSRKDDVGSNLSLFFALPKVFGIVGPLIAAVTIYFVGFVPLFVFASIVLLLSYLPLVKINENFVKINLHITQTFTKLRKRKKLFILEAFDNIIEESEWFWAIFVFLMIGTLESPGIVGALASLGSAVFALFVGKKVDRGSAMKFIMISAAVLMTLWAIRFFIETPLTAYAITICASFMMTMFVVSYTSLILKEVKHEDEEEFMILREIPTVFGRLIVFGVILLCTQYLLLFFILPIVALVVTVFLLRSHLSSPGQR